MQQMRRTGRKALIQSSPRSQWRVGSLTESVSLLERLHAEARNGAAWYSLHANRWARIYLTLGLPAAVLAAVAGVTALASTTSRVAAGIIALASAGVSAAAAFLDSRNNQKSCEALAASWSGFGSDVQQILTFDAARLAEVAERVVRLDTGNAMRVLRNWIADVARGRRVLRNHEEELQRKINDLLMRQKDLLAGKIAACRRKRVLCYRINGT